MAAQVNRLGRLDAVIHNAGVLRGPQTLPVNVVAPYLLTALTHRPQRLVYLSSDMHHGGRAHVAGQDWRGRRETGSYSDSKLFVTTLALAVARIWPDVASNAVDPRLGADQHGWPRSARRLPAGTPDSRVARHQRRTRGPQQRRLLVPPATPHAAPAALDPEFQDDLLAALARFTGEPLV